MVGNDVERLIRLLSKLPGLGPRSARRAALHMIQKRESVMEPLNQHSEPALMPQRMIPCSQACRRVLSMPWARHTSSIWKEFPPPT